jgi:hypothetical protein
MTEKYAHLAPDHLRAEIARTERAVEPLAGSSKSSHDDRAAQVVDHPRERWGSSEAEQLIRNPRPGRRTPPQPDVTTRESDPPR